VERILSLLLIVALTLFNEAAPVPLHIPSVFHNDLDEEEAEKTFCLEKESIEERSKENTRNRVSHISSGSGDAEVSPYFLSGAGWPLPLHRFYDVVFQSITDHAFCLLRSLVGTPLYILDCDRMQCPAFRAQEHSCAAFT
jgi:hypothetical protein